MRKCDKENFMKETETGLNIIAVYPVRDNLLRLFLGENFPCKYKAMKMKGNHQQKSFPESFEFVP